MSEKYFIAALDPFRTFNKFLFFFYIEYLGTQRIASHNEHVGIALSTVGTCLLVWAKIGQHWKKIGVNSTENPYAAFLGHVMKNTDTAYMTELLDGYYERLPSSALQKRMVDAYVESVQFEYRFASAFYNFAAPESTPPPKFTDLFNLISPEVAKSVTSHLLYVEIGNGTLPLSKYIDLIQQSLLFQRGFHAAWESLERKESDLSLKPRLLAESNTETYKSLQGQMKEFNFADGASTAGYAAGESFLPTTRMLIIIFYFLVFLDYIHHLTGIGRNGRVAEGIVALYPRYLLWDEIGAQVNKGIPDIGTHPYKTWLKMVNPENPPDRLSRMRDLTNEYYERESLEGKYRMINVMRQSITHELQFVNGVYGAIQNLI